MRIAILLTVFNRMEITRKSLKTLSNLQEPSLDIDIYVVDGGSDDGTVQMLDLEFPLIKSRILKGAYWNQGMTHAWDWASSREYDFFLLLNDDVELSDSWLFQMLETYLREKPFSIIVGKILDRNTGHKIYGGLYQKNRISKLNFTLECTSNRKIATFNGNCVLIPSCVHRELGTLNPKYSHSFGDIDYGLRASKIGIPIRETESAIGYSTRNNTIYSGNLTLKPSIREVFSPKGIPPTEWLFFCKSFGGVLWPINYFFRYIKLFFFTQTYRRF